MTIKSKTTERKYPTEIKRLVVKCHVPVAPFRNATALEGDPLELVATVF